MRGVFFLQALENFVGLFRSWRLHGDRLEAALQSRVFLDVFAIFIECGRANALDFAARKRWLQNIAGVDRALGATCAYKRVQLVNEQNNVLGAAHFIHNGLDALLKLTAVLCSRNHHGQVKHNKSLVMQKVWNFLRNNLLRKTFNNRRLTNTSFAKKNGIVFGASTQHLNQSFNFTEATNDRIKFTSARKLREIAAE